MLSCRLHQDANNFAIAIGMTFAMDIICLAPINRLFFILKKMTALFSTETAKQDTLKKIRAKICI
jgi:hypothetical protein